MKSVAQRITSRIKRNKRGWVFTPKDFLDLGNRQNVDFVLHRLVKGGTIRRLSRGLYDYPAKHPLLGTLLPSQDAVAQAVARANNDVIRVSGAMAANLLHLSTQVPAKAIFVTHKTKKTIRIGNMSIVLKPTSLPIDDTNDRITMVMQALNYLGDSNIDDKVITQCRAVLGDKDRHGLLKYTKQVRGSWLANALRQIAA